MAIRVFSIVFSFLWIQLINGDWLMTRYWLAALERRAFRIDRSARRIVYRAKSFAQAARRISIEYAILPCQSFKKAIRFRSGFPYFLVREC
ncbi:hypothetical protein [Paraburkholderia terricola]|uniref:Secreted protein n=1 Tax=Paraburkholderia terricola TaxID=169427 RepID=A0ABU1LRR0_9BURK|nr:hypothetical protein [Paraburkholderia terricola]MDR6409384.1 hypothetical protein [Paraburkholderia terricola]MDR6482353.1 hypothetical protein [Paraburkholderia terricola]